jgi:hypothetical protein
MRSRVFPETGRVPLSAYETVLIETPVAWATSWIEVMATPTSSELLGGEAFREALRHRC